MRCFKINPDCALALLVLLIFQACASPTSNAQPPSENRTPVIYSSDLWFPHGDPDDHFDLLSLLSLPELDVKAVIIDYTMQANVKRTKIEKGPNFAAVEKAIKLFKREPVPVRSGLIEPLLSTEDDGRTRPEEEQHAIELIIEQMNAVQDKSAVLITTGSVRDIYAAFNREPDLFKAKVKNIFISMGDSYGITATTDTNVAKDIEAWKGLMVSGLPISWMPTNPSKRRGGTSRYVSYWHFVQEELLTASPKSIQEFFLSEGIPLGLSQGRPVRSMWSTPAFIEAAGLECYEVDGEIRWLSKEEVSNVKGAKLIYPYSFVPIRLQMKDNGEVIWEETEVGDETSIRIFKMNDYFLYHDAMLMFLKNQLGAVDDN